jgi:hypothetical protein
MSSADCWLTGLVVIINLRVMLTSALRALVKDSKLEMIDEI